MWPEIKSIGSLCLYDLWSPATVMTSCSLLINYLKGPMLLSLNLHMFTYLRYLATPVSFPVQPFSLLKRLPLGSMFNPELTEFFPYTLLLPEPSFPWSCHYLNSLKCWDIYLCHAGLLKSGTYWPPFLTSEGLWQLDPIASLPSSCWQEPQPGHDGLYNTWASEFLESNSFAHSTSTT